MKAYFYSLEFFPEFDFGENGILAVETNHFRFFRDVAGDLKGISEECKEIAFYEKEKRLLIEKDYFLFIDYYDSETIGRTLNGKVLKKISAGLEEDPAEHLKFSSLLSGLYSFVLSRLDDEEISFDSEGERSFEEVLKLFSVAVSQPREDIFGKILNVIEVAGKLNVVKFLAFINAKSFFSETELTEIMKMAAYRNVKLFFLDKGITEKKFFGEKLLCVDESFFEKVL